MIVDTSVLICILFGEGNANRALQALGTTTGLLTPAPILLETEIVYGSKRGFHTGDVTELLERLAIRIIPFTEEHAREARLAYARFGKGQGNLAQLNFGDCIGYGVARVLELPLMFIGDDFDKTDLETVKLG